MLLLTFEFLNLLLQPRLPILKDRRPQLDLPRPKLQTIQVRLQRREVLMPRVVEVDHIRVLGLDVAVLGIRDVQRLLKIEVKRGRQRLGA